MENSKQLPDTGFQLEKLESVSVSGAEGGIATAEKTSLSPSQTPCSHAHCMGPKIPVLHPKDIANEYTKLEEQKHRIVSPFWNFILLGKNPGLNSVSQRCNHSNHWRFRLLVLTSPIFICIPS